MKSSNSERAWFQLQSHYGSRLRFCLFWGCHNLEMVPRLRAVVGLCLTLLHYFKASTQQVVWEVNITINIVWHFIHACSAWCQVETVQSVWCSLSIWQDSSFNVMNSYCYRSRQEHSRRVYSTLYVNTSWYVIYHSLTVNPIRLCLILTGDLVSSSAKLAGTIGFSSKEYWKSVLW